MRLQYRLLCMFEFFPTHRQSSNYVLNQNPNRLLLRQIILDKAHRKQGANYHQPVGKRHPLYVPRMSLKSDSHLRNQHHL